MGTMNETPRAEERPAVTGDVCSKWSLGDDHDNAECEERGEDYAGLSSDARQQYFALVCESPSLDWSANPTEIFLVDQLQLAQNGGAEAWRAAKAFARIAVACLAHEIARSADHGSALVLQLRGFVTQLAFATVTFPSPALTRELREAQRAAADDVRLFAVYNVAVAASRALELAHRYLGTVQRDVICWSTAHEALSSAWSTMRVASFDAERLIGTTAATMSFAADVPPMTWEAKGWAAYATPGARDHVSGNAVRFGSCGWHMAAWRVVATAEPEDRDAVAREVGAAFVDAFTAALLELDGDIRARAAYADMPAVFNKRLRVLSALSEADANEELCDTGAAAAAFSDLLIVIDERMMAETGNDDMTSEADVHLGALVSPILRAKMPAEVVAVVDAWIAADARRAVREAAEANPPPALVDRQALTANEAAALANSAAREGTLRLFAAIGARREAAAASATASRRPAIETQRENDHLTTYAGQQEASARRAAALAQPCATHGMSHEPDCRACRAYAAGLPESVTA